MKTKIVFTIIGIALLGFKGWSQNWTLQECISFATENNLQMANAYYNAQDAAWDQKRNKWSRLPSVSADVGGGYQFGRTIDPTTNTFESNTISYSSYGVTASVPVYNGGRINKRVEQGNIQLRLNEVEQKAIARDLQLAVTQAYLNVLLAKENLENMQIAWQQSKAQLSQIEKQIELGAAAQNQQLEFAAQVLRDYKNIVEAENQLEINYLNLKQQMGMDSDSELQVSQPDVMDQLVISDNYDWSSLLHQAENNEPGLKADQLRLQSAEKEVEISKSNFYPSVSLFGTLSTNSSSEAKTLDGTERILAPEQGTLNGEEVLFGFYQNIPNLSEVKYFKQLEDNFGQGVGVSVSVPIFQSGQNKIAVEKAKVNVLRSRVNYQQNRQNLQMDVLKAFNNWKSSKESYSVAQESRKAFELASNDAQRRFDLGRGSAFEVTTAKNNLDKAKFELTQSKYQLIFNQYILDFYTGQKNQN